MKSDIVIETEYLSVCPICGSGDICTVLCGRDFESDTGFYNIDTCKNCGIHFTNPRPTEESVPALYESRSSSDFVNPGGRLVEYLRRESVKSHINRILSPTNGKLSVLDFGCGDGFFSLQLHRHPKCGQIVATDFHEKPPPLLENEKEIIYHSYHKFAECSDSYDAIFCRNVLEHLPNPGDAVNKMRNKLNCGGFLVVDVPNYDSAWRRIFKKYYFGLYLPRHLFHFTGKDIPHIMKGFEKTRVFKSHTPVLGRSLGYLLGNSLQNVGLMGLSLFPFQFFFDSVMGTSSMISITAQYGRCGSIGANK